MEDRYSPEPSLLGMAFLDTNGAMRKAHAAGIAPQHFSDPERKQVWAAMLANYSDGLATDPLSLAARNADLLPLAPKMLDWMQDAWTTLNPDAFIVALIEQEHENEVKRIAADTSVGKLTPEKATRLRKKLDDAPKAQGEALSSVQISDSLEKDFEKRIVAWRSGKPLGISTGWKPLDRFILGWQPESFNVIAARSGMGKTALAVNFALLAAKQNYAVLFFSLEMELRAVASRMYANLGGFDSSRCLEGSLDDADLDRLHQAMGAFRSLPIQICTKVRGGKLDSLRHEIVKQAERQKTDLIIVDQISHLNVGTMSRREEVTRITREMKALAKQLGTPIIALNQIQRPDTNNIQPPQLWNLKESGSVEEDADTVLMLHRESAYGIGSRNTLFVRKARNGSVGEFDIAIDLARQRMAPMKPCDQGAPNK